MKKIVIGVLAFSSVLAAAQQRPWKPSGTIKNRNRGIVVVRPGVRPPAVVLPSPRPPLRPGFRPPLRPVYRPDIYWAIRRARRDRFIFLTGLAIIGAAVRSLPPKHTTVIVQGTTYYASAGTYYVKSGSEYKVVAAPPGAVLTEAPEGALALDVNGVTYLYFNGAYYAQAPSGFQVVLPPAGVVVPGLPDGATKQGPYFVFGGVYYLEVLIDGERGYQVVPKPADL